MSRSFRFVIASLVCECAITDAVVAVAVALVGVYSIFTNSLTNTHRHTHTNTQDQHAYHSQTQSGKYLCCSGVAVADAVECLTHCIWRACNSTAMPFAR